MNIAVFRGGANSVTPTFKYLHLIAGVRLSIILLLFTLVSPLLAQTPNEYSKLLAIADSLYWKGDYKGSGLVYTKAFKINHWKSNSINRYNAACSWSRAGVKDSAFLNLERIVTRDHYSQYNQIINDTDLASLHDDRRWESLINKVKQNKAAKESKFDKKLMSTLDSLTAQDQKARKQISLYRNGTTDQKKTVDDSLWHSINKTDSLNYFLVKEIFQKYGYPNYDLVGTKGSNDFWLLVQHQDRYPQFQEEVLVKMKMEVDRGKADGIDYAYLVDRVKVNTGQLQIYGTQMKYNSDTTSFEPKPVVDPQKLNERRKSVNLSTIEDYVESMNSVYYGSLKKK